MSALKRAVRYATYRFHVAYLTLRNRLCFLPSFCSYGTRIHLVFAGVETHGSASPRRPITLLLQNLIFTSFKQQNNLSSKRYDIYKNLITSFQIEN